MGIGVYTGLGTIVAAQAPIGERIGPFLFWPLLIGLLAVIVWAYARRLRTDQARGSAGAPRRSGGRGAAVGPDWTKPEAYAEHHRVNWTADPEQFAPTTEHRRLAVTAVFGICGGDPWDVLGLRNRDQAREGLEEAWGIRSRPQLLSRLHWLLREGHRAAFDAEIRIWSRMPEVDPDDRSDDPERAWRREQVLADARGIRDVDFEAWDLLRAAMLCRAGYTLGWLTEVETLDTLNLIAARLQHRYDGWHQMGDHFHRARWYWGGGSGLESRQNDAHDESRLHALTEPARGPWAHVPWEQPLPDSRIILVDALVDEELLVDRPASSPTELAAVIDAATTAALDRRS